MHKVKVVNFYAENTGDDALAFFNVKVRDELAIATCYHPILQTDATVENATIKDSFARSILLHKSPDVKFTNTTVENSPGLKNSK